MGIFLFLIIFLILIFALRPVISGNGRDRGTVEVKGEDGTILLFSDEGISIFRNGEFHFLRKEEIGELSLKRVDSGYILSLRTTNHCYEVPVKEEEVRKLFSGKGNFEASIPWLPIALGTAVPLIFLELPPNGKETGDNREDEFVNEGDFYDGDADI